MTYQGSDLMLFLKSGSKTTSLACATSHTLDVSMNTVDTSTKDNGNGRWQNNEPGLRSWSISSENLVAASDEQGLKLSDLYPLMFNGTKVEVVFALQNNISDYSEKLEDEFTAPTGGWTPDEENCLKGQALITALNITAGNDGKATASITLTGCGSLSMVGSGPAGKAVAKQQSLSAPVAPVETAAKSTASSK